MMKYIGILAVLAVACLLAIPALSVADGNGLMGNQNGNAPQGNCGQCCGNCQCGGSCNEDSLGAQNQYGQNSGCNGGCQGAGAYDGTGPKGDGSCKLAA